MKRTRSQLLHGIEQALERHGVRSRIDSVPALRSVLPGYVLPLNKDGLAWLLRTLGRCEPAKVDRWRQRPVKISRYRRVSELSDEAIVALRADRRSVAEIANRAGVTVGRIYQILSKYKEKNLET